jgi:hypothetical protein
MPQRGAALFLAIACRHDCIQSLHLHAAGDDEMAQVQIKGYVTASRFDHMQPGDPLYWSFQSWKPGSEQASCLHSFAHTFTVDAPDFNPIEAEVAAIERAKASALAEFQATVGKLNERLSKLQALTNEVQA